MVNGKPLLEHQLEAIDNNDKAPLDIRSTTARKAGEPYDVYYNPDFVENGVRKKVPGYVTNLTTDFAMNWLDNRDKSKPFFLL